jgi:hypothetical protein
MKKSAAKLAAIAGAVLTATVLSANAASAWTIRPIPPRFNRCQLFATQLTLLSNQETLRGDCFDANAWVTITFSTPPSSGGTPYTEHAVTDSNGTFTAPMHLIFLEKEDATETIRAVSRTRSATLSEPDWIAR